MAAYSPDHRWLALFAGICVHAAVKPAAAGSACFCLDQQLPVEVLACCQPPAVQPVEEAVYLIFNE